MKKYNHLYGFAFSLDTDRPAEWPASPTELIAAILKRIANLSEGDRPGDEWNEAVGCPLETVENQPDCEVKIAPRVKYRVKVTSGRAPEDLHGLDRGVVGVYDIEAESPGSALDYFHETVPIKVLEDFDISATPIEDKGMTTMKARLIEFAEFTLKTMEQDDDWSMDTLQEIDCKAQELELAESPEGQFKRIFYRGRSRMHRKAS